MAQGTSVLIVDDDSDFRNTMSRILAKKGYQSATAKDGFECLDLVKENTYDIVLMDIKMPTMDGVETYKKIKNIRPHTVVIMMTAFSVDKLISDAVKEGVYAVLHKPFDIDTVINMIERSKNGAFIAVVDDDPDICKTMKGILERNGYSVITVTSGEEAIMRAKERPIDVLFIDIKLPVLNGLETYLEIKKVNPGATVVMMTAYCQEMGEIIKEALENGAYACLCKPFDMNKVIKIIDEVSNRKHGK